MADQAATRAEAAKQAAATAERLRRRAGQRAEELAVRLKRTARTLEASAALADEHAQRRERQGQTDASTAERGAAKRAGDAAERARMQAEELLELSPPAGST